MKNRTIFVVLLAVVLIGTEACKHSLDTTTSVPSPSPTPSPVQSNFKPISSYPAPVLGKPYPGKGIVKLINRKEGWIEIVHEDIVDLMPAMEMEWFVEKSSLLNGLNVGDKVTFTIVETKERGQILTSIKKIKE